MDKRYLPPTLDGQAWETHYRRMAAGQLDYSPALPFYTLKRSEHLPAKQDENKQNIELISPVETDISQAAEQLKEEEKQTVNTNKRPPTDSVTLRPPPSKRAKPIQINNSSYQQDILD
jgi:hypothetical protein